MSPEPSPESEFRGTTRFRPLDVLGRGTAGTVYRVRDEELGTEVALKTLHALTPEQIYRLKNEFRALAGVVHPHLVQLHELVVSEEQCFFTMDLIDGLNFVDHVRGGAVTPEEILSRFQSAAPQLVRGVAALHAAGRLHRDIKPSNIRVTGDGRVVLLDFDLVAFLGGDDQSQSLASAAAGTFAYMAPEQLWGRGVGPAADLYAVGVVFFESLAGRLPAEGGTPAFLRRGAAARTPRLAEIVASVPAWLDELTAALLLPEPAARPTATQVLSHFEPAAASEPRPAPRPHFVGRKRELARLGDLARAARSRATVAILRGPSGIGKSELVRHLLAELEADDETLVLRGRCHPQEAVPYKAIDPLVDSISRHLLTLPEEEARTLLPNRVDALTRLFPVLGRVPGAAATRSRAEVDAAELRHLAFGAFRELLAGIASRRRLALWIDDLQWSDADSGNVLTALLSPPDPPPLLLLLTRRSEEGAGDVAGVLEKLRSRSGGAEFHDLDIDPLTRAEAAELALGLGSGADAERLAAQSGGSPFLLAELARAVGSAAPDGAAEFDLDDVIRGRVGKLPDLERLLVELVSVAGGPIDRGVLLQAAARGEAGRPTVARLEAECLVRATYDGTRPRIETYHDRIREAVLAPIAAERLSDRHRDLAVALESSGLGEPENLAHHFHGAGLNGKAADYAVAAADRALDTLAFERAAEFYQRARVWDPRDTAWQRVLLSREGEALASASRFADGARAFLDAADGASRLEGLELRRRATEQYFAGGRFDDGIATLSALSEELEIPYPQTPRRALLGVLRHLVRLFLGGLRRSKSAGLPEIEDLLRIDTCYSVGKNLVNADSTLGVYFSLEALSRALRADDPVRLGRSLCVVGGSLSVAGNRLLESLGERMMRLAIEISAETGDPHLRGTIAIARGQVAMLAGRWKECLRRMDDGVRLLSTSCRGVAFECNIGRGLAQRALEELGDVDELEKRSRESLHAAVATGAYYAEVAAAQHLSMALLARGDLAGARTLSGRVQELWSDDKLYMQHVYAIRQRAYCDLYGDDPAASLRTLEQLWPALRRSNLLRISLLRVDVTSLRARLAVATAARSDSERAALLRDAARDARRLLREGRGDAAVYAHLVLAGIAAQSGAPERALADLERAEAAAAAADMPLHAASARLRRGDLLGGAAGAALSAEAEAHLANAGVRQPRDWARMHAPGARGSG